MSIGTVHLARSPLRLLVVPLVVVLVGGIATAVGLLVGGPIGISVLAGGAIVLVLAVYLTAVVLSMRVEVEAGALVLRWLGGSRRYALVRGAVTRVTVRGSAAAPLHRGLTALAWGIGAATLRGEERIELVRLASTPSMILVPTDHGRLAIAAANDDELLGLLATAARLPTAAPVPTFRPAEPAVQAVSLPSASWPETEASEQPRILTGIERALLEERLRAERAAAQAAAEAERQAAEAAGEGGGEAAPLMAEVAAPPETLEEAAAAPTVAPSRARRRQRARWQQPSWLRLPAWMRPPPLAARAIPVVMPLATVAVIWIVALLGGHLEATTPEARYLVLSLVLCGPVAALGMLITRAWQPRLGGLVACSAFAAQVLLVRVLIG